MKTYRIKGMLAGTNLPGAHVLGYMRAIKGIGVIEFVTVTPGAIVTDQHHNIPEMIEKGVVLEELKPPREPAPCD
jgi:hypothetical protein